MRITLIALFSATAQASFAAIYNYKPNSKVTDHNAIDLDQAAMEAELAKTTVGYAAAKKVYESGGHSKVYAQFKATMTLAKSFTAEVATCNGKDEKGNDITGLKLKSGLTGGGGNVEHTFECLYPTSETQATYQNCKANGLGGAGATDGCLVITSDVTIKETGMTDVVVAKADMGSLAQKAGRTLDGFSKSSTMTKKMYTNSADCPGCPYSEYTKYYNYYGTHAYVDEYVTGALDSAKVEYISTPVASYLKTADFSVHADDDTRVEAAKKASAYMSVYMYVIREFEDAIDDCTIGSLNNNYGSVHAWDEGVAFYVGSLEGTDGKGKGKLLSALADKRAGNFGTANTDGVSNVMTALIAEFNLGRNTLLIKDCGAVRPILTKVTNLMRVPLIQGVLRYAYKMGTYGPAGSDTNKAGSKSLLKENSEGATFAYAVLPALASCSSTSAKVVYDNMKHGAGALAGFNMNAVKTAFEASYDCLGITCEHIGALNIAGGLVKADDPWGTPCISDSASSAKGELAFAKIAGYTPRSKVTDHNALDLDMQVIAAQLDLGNAAGFAVATAVYEGGGNSKSYAEMTVPGTDVGGAETPAFKAKTVVRGIKTNGASVTGTLKADAAKGAKKLQVVYDTNSDQDNHNGGCSVGGLPAASQKTVGCFKVDTIVVDSVAINPTAIVNKGGRTLQGFATVKTTTDKMYKQSAGCPGCPYADFTKFYDYYGDLDYADKFVSGALAGTKVTFTKGADADFATYNDMKTRNECASKGAAYMNNWMYVVREFEDAIDDCTTSSIDNNFGSAHAWDEGVAFYVGSLEGTDGAGPGEMNYALAEKRCSNFGTCVGLDGKLGATGKAQSNIDLIAEWTVAQTYLFTKQCALVRPVLRRVVSKMTVPLVQGVLRYAYYLGTMGPMGTGENKAGSPTLLKHNAEGAAFAFSMLPLLNSCNKDDAKIVYDNMKLGGSAVTDKMAVKKALEKNYECLGITCIDVGAYLESAGLVAGDAFGTACVDKASGVIEVPTFPAGGIAGIIIASLLAVVFFGFVCMMYRAEKSGKPIFSTLGK